MAMGDCTSSSISPYSCLTRFRFPPSSVHTISISFLGSFHFSRRTIFSLKISEYSNPSSSTSSQHRFFEELEFKERETTTPGFELGGNGDQDTNFLQFDDGNEGEDEEDLVKLKVGEPEDVISERVDVATDNQVKVVRKGKQLMKRSNVIAKQVISIQSALSLGFISQLWVDTNTWMVVIVEVRPNLLSGEQERFFLEDTRQVGDVVLVENETVMDNDLKIVGLETLVGYNVVTPGRRDIGKVRGYTFNINSGAIESLELDSFGISIIPSSLVSTYALLVEDVLEVVSETVVVHEAAASRIQRLTKGFWDAQRGSYSMEDVDDYSDLRGQSEYQKGRGRRSTQKSRRRPIDGSEENWDLPLDYL